jgi:hypothetical protein
VKAAKKAAKKKQPTKPGTTEVEDRVVGMPLGREAKMLAALLRGYGADPKLVPDLRDVAARSNWTVERGGYPKRVPMWLLDLTVAVLDQIPQRSLRKVGHPKQDAVKDVEFWVDVMRMPAAASGRLVAKARQRADGTLEDDIQKRADDLANRIYRRSKPDMS